MYRHDWYAGIDEAGRGPLAGAVVASAVILDPFRPLPGLRDSKALGEPARRTLAEKIRRDATAFAIGRAEPAEIDAMNILQATLLAMQRAVAALPVPADYAVVDGNCLPTLDCPCDYLVKGDARMPAIMAASILAKVYRDEEMCRLDAVHPGYGFAAHKGYPTRTHLDALQRLGPTPVHRRSFAPVAAVQRRLC